MLQQYEKLKSALSSAKKIVFFTGAGISAESGIPTFRGKDGIWNKMKPDELANFNAFLRNPQIVWDWYQYRKKIVHQASPNHAHLTISEFQNYFDEVLVVTQNVDGFHSRAGSEIVYELHGNIEKNYCIDCGKRFDFENLEIEGKVPKCGCGGLIRPDIVWFGELLPEDAYSLSELAAETCDILFVIGTSALVFPAANIPYIAKKHGKFLVEVNIEKTELSSIVDLSLFGKAGEILPQILQRVKEEKSYGKN
ncbi:MAG: NAD-dependent protein deacylase [Ignavibacteria bacterium CG_4_8_14_3_um_filter_37_9]|nr:NAD-dependent deacylase [Ignavibacteria bacterium]OIO17216.1 MAG: NAD-dependent protein deacylase [Ignavibacteria bacterium CG1_02_37_35]PIP76440.1 MAG: NAD-dependent protein deacylase [Ignavibacteria bacterium CG22_combo_CG10-13_8_21_14_all_37_15]PIS46001.1 MAG: NAD-dependent protein deacylase [Ignavibacteria bacterium CG08_land_8_20_14_0_20_37_9]PIW99301.1 MAG: NAD-dependent protein deacylase [Ignavibacteria bacterium CG_4_8_14_3_um_filter_37_9]PIX95298.1 MAG: NAD-dependent protein deacyl